MSEPRDGHTVGEMLHRANESLTAAAVSCVDEDTDGALDDIVAARLLIAAALLVAQANSVVGCPEVG